MASKFLRSFSQSYHASTTPTHIERLCTSWLLPPLFLFALRALISLYAFLVLFIRIGLETTSGDDEAAAHSFSYFTLLEYWGLAFYFAFAAAHTASYAFRGQAWLQSWPGVLKWLHSTFYVTTTVFPFVVTSTCPLPWTIETRLNSICSCILVATSVATSPRSPRNGDERVDKHQRARSELCLRFSGNYID